MYVVYIWKWSSAHALGVSGVASFITTDEQLQWNRCCWFLEQTMLPEGFPFHQFSSPQHRLLTMSFCDRPPSQKWCLGIGSNGTTSLCSHIFLVMPPLHKVKELYIETTPEDERNLSETLFSTKTGWYFAFKTSNTCGDVQDNSYFQLVGITL